MADPEIVNGGWPAMSVVMWWSKLRNWRLRGSLTESTDLVFINDCHNWH